MVVWMGNFGRLVMEEGGGHFLGHRKKGTDRGRKNLDTENLPHCLLASPSYSAILADVSGM